MNRKHSTGRHSMSLFWEFILIYTMLVLLTSVLLGSVLTGVYLRSINQRSQDMIQSQAEHAVEDLKAQLDSMRTLSLKLSVQRIFSPDYFKKSKAHEIELLDALEQYQSYSSLATEFLLLYRNVSGNEISVFKSDGTKTDLDVYLNRYGIEKDESLLYFLFEDDEHTRLMRFPGCVLIACTVRRGAYASPEECGALCFVLGPSALESRIEFSSNIQPGSYALSYLGLPLIENTGEGTLIRAGYEDSFSMDVFVPKVSLRELLSRWQDMVLFLICIVVLLVCIILLAYRCYRPIRSLIHKYTGESGCGGPSNEWAALDRVMEQLQTRSQILDKQASSRTALLRNYALLMLFNNVSAASHLADFEKIGLFLDKPLFCVLAIMPCAGQIVSPDSMDVVAASMDDMAEDAGTLYAVECDPVAHTLAVLCNADAPEHMDILQQRVRTYLNCQSIRFVIGTGTVVESIAGVSSSYLAALGRLQDSAGSISGAKPAMGSDHSETAVLLRQMLDKIECSDCQGALLDLEAYMERQGPQVSELMRRYNLFNVKCAIQQLCEKMGYRLSSEQMSMLLTMSDVQSVHYALLQLIPAMCAHVQSLSRRAVVSASNLVMEYLHAHFCEYDISAQCIAEAVGIGINRTNSIIKEATGQSCKAYLTQLRLERAKALLLETDASVSDICPQVGYNSASHFIKVFRTAVGQTPDAFRKSRED